MTVTTTTISHPRKYPPTSSQWAAPSALRRPSPFGRADRVAERSPRGYRAGAPLRRSLSPPSTPRLRAARLTLKPSLSPPPGHAPAALLFPPNGGCGPRYFRPIAERLRPISGGGVPLRGCRSLLSLPFLRRPPCRIYGRRDVSRLRPHAGALVPPEGVPSLPPSEFLPCRAPPFAPSGGALSLR